MNRRWLFGVGLTASLSLVSCAPEPIRTQAEAPPIALTEALGSFASAEGFAVATEPREFSFPADHGPHPDFRTEWWYFTGNLETAEGDHYGYQFTLFRTALAAPDAEVLDPGADPAATAPSEGALSDWSTRQLYMAHIGLTDVEGREFFSDERYARGAAGLAGVETGPFAAWLDGWSFRSADPEDLFPGRLRVAAKADANGRPSVILDLTLHPGKPIVLQGDRGLSRKSSTAESASYYYSYTRLPTEGTLLVPRHEGTAQTVHGSSWMDREWSTSLLGEQHSGWDWFSLQLDSGQELMFFRLRTTDGGVDPFSSGSWVEAGGSYRTLAPGEVEITPKKQWQSPRGGLYPVSWQLTSESLGIELEISARLEDQEHRQSVAYWEGTVSLRGEVNGEPTAGSGFVEMTGYGD